MSKRAIITGALILALMLILVSIAGAVSDSKLEVEWSATLGIGKPASGAYCGRETTKGGYIVAGGIDNPTSRSVDIRVVKLDNLRNTVWQRTWGGKGTNEAHEAQETVGGYFVGGETEALGSGGGFVFKVDDSSGNMVWPSPVTFGGAGNGCIFTILSLSDGGCIVGGYIISSGMRGLLSRLNSSGGIVWQKTFDDCLAVRGMTKTSDGNVAITGDTQWSDANAFDVYLAKINISNGDYWWPWKMTTFGGGDFDVGQSVQQTPDNGFIIAGYSFSFSANAYPDGYVIKTDSSGKLVWQKTYGGLGNEVFFSIQMVANSYILAGRTSSFGAGGQDGWIVKLDWSGNQINQLTFGTAGHDETAWYASQTTDGGCLIAGKIWPSGGVSCDMHILKLKAPITSVKRWAKYE